MDGAGFCNEADAVACLAHAQAEVQIASVKFAIWIVPAYLFEHVASRHHKSACDERHISGFEWLRRFRHVLADMAQVEPYRLATHCARPCEPATRMLDEPIRVEQQCTRDADRSVLERGFHGCKRGGVDGAVIAAESDVAPYRRRDALIGDCAGCPLVIAAE